jgi:hypothetical protein
MTTPNRVRAVVRVIMDVESDSVWSGTTTFDQIAKQAADGVKGMLTSNNELLLKDIPRRVKSVECIEVKVYPEEK